MVAVPKNVDISGRKYITAANPITELQQLNAMALYNTTTIDYLKSYLKQYQVELWTQQFTVEEGIIKPGETSTGSNYWGVVEGRKTHNLECFVLAFDPGKFKLISKFL